LFDIIKTFRGKKMIDNEPSTDGFLPSELAECPICHKHFWSDEDVMKAHILHCKSDIKVNYGGRK
jgi:hypothetical protein